MAVLREENPPKRAGAWRYVAAIGAIYLALAALSARVGVPPLVESDYAYQLLAADRLVEGKGFTSLQPVAPGQPWVWRYDWGFLTQWPAGYALLVAGIRFVTGGKSLDACALIGCAAAALAAVGWFAWLRRCAPGGLAGWLLALCGAAAALSPALLVNPSTDALLVAAVPWMMLMALRVGDVQGSGKENDADAQPRSIVMGSIAALLCGLLAGGLVWFRYAAVFVPGAILVALILRAQWRRAVAFAVGAAIPVVALMILNAALAQGTGVQEQLNLGQSMQARLESSLLTEAWQRWTDLGYYNHMPLAHQILAVLPALVLIAATLPLDIDRRVRATLLSPAGVLSLTMLGCGLGLIVAATALFGEKFNYVGLDRYYLPLRPLYFAVVLAPLLTVVSPSRTGGDVSAVALPRSFALVARGCAIIGLVIALNWSVQQDWRRTMLRWSAAQRPVTEYGQWARCFAGDSAELYGWLRAQETPQLIIVSNFHEYVALETGLPTLPVPPDAATLNEWLVRIQDARQVKQSRVLFVLDGDNRWRDYWIAEPADIVREFGLVPTPAAPSALAQWVYEPAPAVIAQRAARE